MGTGALMQRTMNEILNIDREVATLLGASTTA